jgi:hypothetical protein
MNKLKNEFGVKVGESKNTDLYNTIAFIVLCVHNAENPSMHKVVKNKFKGHRS